MNYQLLMLIISFILLLIILYIVFQIYKMKKYLINKIKERENLYSSSQGYTEDFRKHMNNLLNER